MLSISCFFGADSLSHQNEKSSKTERVRKTQNGSDLSLQTDGALLLIQKPPEHVKNGKTKFINKVDGIRCVVLPSLDKCGLRVFIKQFQLGGGGFIFCLALALKWAPTHLSFVKQLNQRLNKGGEKTMQI